MRDGGGGQRGACGDVQSAESAVCVQGRCDLQLAEGNWDHRYARHGREGVAWRPALSRTGPVPPHRASRLVKECDGQQKLWLRGLPGKEVLP
eukprot:3231256-Pyramimonas_sp.AAC.1